MTVIQGIELAHEFYHPVFKRTYQYGWSKSRRLMVRSKSAVEEYWSNWIPMLEEKQYSSVERAFGLIVNLN